LLRETEVPAMTDHASAHVFDATAATFEAEVLQASLQAPVLVDFWAEWCGPCKSIAPILGELSTDLDGQVTIAKVNVDDNPDLAMRYNVMSIPTLLVFNGGEVQKRLVGAKGKSQLLQELDEFLVSSS
jgi:thioredoxin 1